MNCNIQLTIPTSGDKNQCCGSQCQWLWRREQNLWCRLFDDRLDTGDTSDPYRCMGCLRAEYHEQFQSHEVVVLFTLEIRSNSAVSHCSIQAVRGYGIVVSGGGLSTNGEPATVAGWLSRLSDDEELDTHVIPGAINPPDFSDVYAIADALRSGYRKAFGEDFH